MAVKLRLARIGKKHDPMFRVVAIDSRKNRDSDYLENLGTYNPQTGEYVQFHVDRIDAWIEKGAIVTDSVKKLYRRYKKGAQPVAKDASNVAPAEPKKVEEPVEKVEEKVVVEVVEEKATTPAPEASVEKKEEEAK